MSNRITTDEVMDYIRNRERLLNLGIAMLRGGIRSIKATKDAKQAAIDFLRKEVNALDDKLNGRNREAEATAQREQEEKWKKADREEQEKWKKHQIEWGTRIEEDRAKKVPRDAFNRAREALQKTRASAYDYIIGSGRLILGDIWYHDLERLRDEGLLQAEICERIRLYAIPTVPTKVRDLIPEIALEDIIKEAEKKEHRDAANAHFFSTLGLVHGREGGKAHAMYMESIGREYGDDKEFASPEGDTK